MSAVEYEGLRTFVDSYGLVATMLLYLALVYWGVRPGAHKHNQDAATMILADDEDAARTDQGGRNHG